MFTITGRGPYLSLTLPRPAPWAARGLDDLRARSVPPAGAWHIPLGAARLIGMGYHQPVGPPSASSWPVRRLEGVLQAPPFYRVRVEIELAPWSAARAELGIRPLGHWPPRMMPSARYHELAEALLMLLAAELIDTGELVA